jgi:acyl-CoA thioesterase I
MQDHSPAALLQCTNVFVTFSQMRQTRFPLILAVVTLTILGCRADRASRESSDTDSRVSTAAASTASAPSPGPASALPPAEDHRPLIACFGDSLTAGFGADPGQSYPDYLQTDLDDRGYHYRVVNEGISGNTTKDGLERINTILALKPALVVVEFGGNDGLRGLRIEDSRASLDKIVATLKSSGTKVVLAGITLPPDYGPDYIQQFNETYALLARKYHVPLLPFLLQGVFGVDGMMQRDRTHATAEGNKVVAKNVMPLVVPFLKK